MTSAALVAMVWTRAFLCAAAVLMVHAASDGEKRIRLPRKCDVREIFGASRSRTGVCEIVEGMKLGETRVFRISAGVNSREWQSW